MKLLEMSISAGALILLLALLRTWDFWSLPKRTARLLWIVALARLLLPASLPVQSKIASPALHLLLKMQEMLQGLGCATNKMLSGDVPEAASFGIETHVADGFIQQAAHWIWMAGMFSLGIYFIRSFLKEYRLLAQALPLDTLPESSPDTLPEGSPDTLPEGSPDTLPESSPDTLPEGSPDTLPEGSPESKSSAYAQILECYKSASRITGVRPKNGKGQLLVHDQIQSPLVFGTIRQKIVLPKSMLHMEPGQMQHVLAHEMIHIKRRDNLWKLAATAAVCLHWFNPLVWLMYLLFARDLELSCDEEVLALYGSHGRMGYAMTLLTLAQNQKETILFSSGFEKNPTKERIMAIMKFKNLSGIGILCSVMLIAGASSVFATSGKEPVAKSRMAEVTENAASRMAEVTEDAASGTAGNGTGTSTKSKTEGTTGAESIDFSLNTDALDSDASATVATETIRINFPDGWEAARPKKEGEIRLFYCDIDEDGVVHIKEPAGELTQEEWIQTE